MRNRIAFLRLTLALGLTAVVTLTAAPKMPRENVIDAPAIGKGLSVHNLFQSNMVLQRAGQSQTATAAKDRAWKVSLPAMPASSIPHKLAVQGKKTRLTLENILVGDVWILGGQSNMEFPLDRVENGQLEIVSANYSAIRILTVPAQNGPSVKQGFPRLHEWSSWSNRHYRKGDWDVCSPKIARELSAIGYVFARRIHMTSQVPIGVIDASRGGTTVETWTPTAVLEKIDTPEVAALLSEWQQKIAAWDSKQDLENRIKNHHNWVKNMKKQGRKADRPIPDDLRPGPAMDHNRPSTCYNSMIAPIAGLAVKGTIFHQGFNNALGSGSAGAAMYYQIFGKMITAWRQAFNDPGMPFGIISLCTAGDPQTRNDYLEKMLNDGIYIREAQYRTFLDFYQAGDKNIGFASSFDKRRSWYHPQLKIPVGERISRWALATQYGLEKDIRWKPPMLKEMQVEAGKIVLKLDANVRAVDDEPISGFAIAGKDRRFQPADVNYLAIGKDQRNQPRYDRRTLVLTSPHVPTPIHFRHAWGRNPLANLQSSDRDDLPFATQRSDDWEMERVPENYVGDSIPPKSELRRIKRFIQRDLRLDDVQRRLKEAIAFVEENEEKYKTERAAAEREKAKERQKKGRK